MIICTHIKKNPPQNKDFHIVDDVLLVGQISVAINNIWTHPNFVRNLFASTTNTFLNEFSKCCMLNSNEYAVVHICPNFCTLSQTDSRRESHMKSGEFYFVKDYVLFRFVCTFVVEPFWRCSRLTNIYS